MSTKSLQARRHLLDPHRLRDQGRHPLQAVGRRCRRRERAGRARQPGADHLAGLVARRLPARLRVVRIAQAGGLRAQRRQRPAAAGGQLQGLQQRAGVVARRQHAGRDAEPRRRLAALHHHVGGGEPRRLTQSNSIDTEPVYSADGSTIYFVSDRGGAPQIYKMGASGGNPTRVTFSGTYNISPSVSPDGRWLAYISRVGGAFKLHVMELATGNVNAITDTTADENPVLRRTASSSCMPPAARPRGADDDHTRRKNKSSAGGTGGRHTGTGLGSVSKAMINLRSSKC